MPINRGAHLADCCRVGIAQSRGYCGGVGRCHSCGATAAWRRLHGNTAQSTWKLVATGNSAAAGKGSKMQQRAVDHSPVGRLEAAKGRQMAAATHADSVRMHEKGGCHTRCHGRREGYSLAETATAVAGMETLVACK